MAEEDVTAAANGGATVVEKSGTFRGYKRQMIVDAQKVGDAVRFYKAVFDAVETGNYRYPKRKADQDLPHLVSSELKLAGTTVVVSDVSVNSGSDAKAGTIQAILETDDVEAAVAKAVAAGAVGEEEVLEVEPDGGLKGRVTDPLGFSWIFISPPKESEKDDHEEVVFCGISSGMGFEVQSETGSAVKRRRMLPFEDQPMETSIFCLNDPVTPTLPDDLEGVDLHKAEWDAESLNDPVTPTLPDDLEGLQCLDLFTSKWYAECFNDPEAPTQHDDLSFGSPVMQIDVSDYLNLSPETETRDVRRPVSRYSPNVVFRGMKSFARPVTKLSSSICYPLTFIKPCGFRGDMTLKDINEIIRTPASKPKEDKAEPPVIPRKRVVGKTRFHTEAGRREAKL